MNFKEEKGNLFGDTKVSFTLYLILFTSSSRLINCNEKIAFLPGKKFTKSATIIKYKRFLVSSNWFLLYDMIWNWFEYFFVVYRLDFCLAVIFGYHRGANPACKKFALLNWTLQLGSITAQIKTATMILITYPSVIRIFIPRFILVNQTGV